MTNFVLHDETHCVKQMARELLQAPENLHDWETGILTTVTNWSGNLTQTLSEAAVRISAKHTGYRPDLK